MGKTEGCSVENIDGGVSMSDDVEGPAMKENGGKGRKRGDLCLSLTEGGKTV